MFTKRYEKQLVATFYFWRGKTIIDEDRCSKLESYIVSSSCFTNVKTWNIYLYIVVDVAFITYKNVVHIMEVIC